MNPKLLDAITELDLFFLNSNIPVEDKELAISAYNTLTKSISMYEEAIEDRKVCDKCNGEIRKMLNED